MGWLVKLNTRLPATSLGLWGSPSILYFAIKNYKYNLSVNYETFIKEVNNANRNRT